MKMSTMEHTMIMKKEIHPYFLRGTFLMMRYPMMPEKTWADQILAPLIQMLKLNWLSMRVGVKNWRFNTMSRNTTMMVVFLRDLKRKRSIIENYLTCIVVFLIIFRLYSSWNYLTVSTVKSGFQIPFILAISMRCLYAFQGLFFVIRLMGVSLKKIIKMTVRMRRGIPKKKRLTFQKSGMRQNQSTLVRAPVLKIEAITILQFCLRFQSTISVMNIQARLKGTIIEAVLRKKPPAPTHIFELRVAIRREPMQTIIPLTKSTLALINPPTIAEKRLPARYPPQKIVLTRSRVACSSGQRQSPNLLANEVMVKSVGRYYFRIYVD